MHHVAQDPREVAAAREAASTIGDRRAVALIDLEDAARLGRVTRDLALVLEPGGRVTVEARDFTRRIREPDVTEAVSRVAAAAPVREGLVRFQRAFARRAGRGGGPPRYGHGGGVPVL